VVDAVTRNNGGGGKSPARADAAKSTARRFLEAYFGKSDADAEELASLFSEDGSFEDYSYSTRIVGKDLERRFRLEREAGYSRTLAIDDIIAAADGSGSTVKVGIEFNLAGANGGKRGLAFVAVDTDTGLVDSVEWVYEPKNKSGEASLRVLSAVSKVLGLGRPSKLVDGSGNRGDAVRSDPPSSSVDAKKTPPELYFEAWNRRDMDAAASLFTNDVEYDDTVFPEPFSGSENLKRHLKKCADVFPATFSFEVDDIVSNDGKALVKWHVENDGTALPFSRGCSFYEFDQFGRQIKRGIDIVEPAGPVKPGGANLFLDSMKKKLTEEPIRLVPTAIWVAYMYVVFFSDGILPGANALVLEERTWKEVLDLSLNFFLVSPLLNLPFSPVVHPMLEGVFNLLLAWAAMFAGFLSDDRRDKPNLIPMLPVVVFMQLLTSAFLLPYLATRSSENCETAVDRQELTLPARLCESPALGGSMAAIGSISIAWALMGRTADFGDLAARWSSFLDLLSIDRVGSSFIVDLVIFGLLGQWWLVDDDLKRRGIFDAEENSQLRFVAKYVPFFGMAAYLCLRPPLPTSKAAQVEDMT